MAGATENHMFNKKHKKFSVIFFPFVYFNIPLKGKIKYYRKNTHLFSWMYFSSEIYILFHVTAYFIWRINLLSKIDRS